MNVVIIGAPRSGTNMLRDVLTSFDGVSTWDCDEINYIWRHGNVRVSNDEFTPALASPRVVGYIRSAFDEIRNKYSANIVVEKTCANSLRVAFVDAVLPDSKYIFIYRDGIDVAGSATLRWTAKLDLLYLFRKMRYVPKSDLPYYALRYIWARLYRLFSKEGRLSSWGPVFSGLSIALKKYSLREVCALQWKCCIERSEDAFKNISHERVFRVKYENFVKHPKAECERLLDFLQLHVDSASIESAVCGVSDRNLGKGRANLSPEDARRIEVLIGDTLRRYDY